MNCCGVRQRLPVAAPGTAASRCASSSTCDVKCNPGYLECSPASLGMCQQTTWDFEDMTLEGFRIVNTPSAAGKLGYTSQVVHSGKFALGAVIKATGTGLTRGYQIGPPICAATRAPSPARELTVTAWMMLEPSDAKQTFGKASYWGIRITTESGETLAKGAPRGYNEWFPVSVTAARRRRPADRVRSRRRVRARGHPAADATGPATSTSTTSRSSSASSRRTRHAVGIR